jgi:hypothetical protein
MKCTLLCCVQIIHQYYMSKRYSALLYVVSIDRRASSDLFLQLMPQCLEQLIVA